MTPDEVKPPEPAVVSTVKETHETVTSQGSTEPVPSPAPAVVADDSSRKYLAVVVILQFLAVVGFIVWTVKQGDTNNAEMMVLGAEIGFVTTVLNYYFGSSSGSTAKSALLEKK